MLPGQSSFVTIIVQYNASLERLARRILIQKERAADVVKWAMEAVYEEEKFYEGPHLRSLLIKKTTDMALGHNKAVALYNKITNNGKVPVITLQADQNPSTRN